MSVTLTPPEKISDERVRDVLLGRDTTLPRSAGFRALLRSARKDKVRLLGRVLENEEEPARIRSLAAATLTQVPSPSIERVLIRASEQTNDQQVLTALARSLGRVGSPKALDAVVRIRKRTSGAAAAQADFAAALLAHRFDLPGHELPGVGELPVQDLPAAIAHDIAVKRAGKKEATAALEALRSEPYGIELSPRALYEARGTRDRWLVALNEEVTRAEGTATLSQRKMLLGLLAHRHEEHGRYATTFLILTAPAGGAGFEVKAHRVDGPPAFVGRAEPDAGGVRFSIRSVDHPGMFPLAVDGRLENGDLTIEIARVGARVPNRRSPASGVGP